MGILSLLWANRYAVIIGAVVIGCIGLGYREGHNACEAVYSVRKDATIEALTKQLEAANQRADAENAAARAAADRESAAKARVTSLLKGIRDAKPVPANCVPDDLRLRINSTVDSINTYGDSASVPDKVPAASTPQ